jgi:hypothetical protein
MGWHCIDVVLPCQSPGPVSHPSSLGTVTVAVQQFPVPGFARAAANKRDHVIHLRPTGADVGREKRLPAPGARPVLLVREFDSAAKFGGTVVSWDAAKRGSRFADA